MAKTEPIGILRTLAKRLARAQRIKHINGLEVIAQRLGHPHWYALTARYKNGWRPSSGQLDELSGFVDTANPLKARRSPSAGLEAISRIPGIEIEVPKSYPGAHGGDFSGEEIFGHLDGHPFCLIIDMDDVIMEGRGWRIIVPEAMSAEPVIKVTDRRFKSLPIHDSGFCDRALQAAKLRADQVRARIASDWPRRSTVPDPDGTVQHPLFEGASNRWFCLHCDHVLTGPEIAGNLWHCPVCNASPIDIMLPRD